MQSAIVGYSGFVGSNIAGSFRFTNQYNSKNIKDAYGSTPDLLVYTGVPAAMFQANAHPENDMALIKNAIENIKRINAKKLILISTIAVFDKTIDVDETYVINEKLLTPYGRNRLYFENWVIENCQDSLVIRLPALYGINLKKNFVYDYINIIPSMLNRQKYQDLCGKNSLISGVYDLQDDGFYHFKDLNYPMKKKIHDIFLGIGFNALNFTDSRSVYQFYNLNRLWNDIVIALNNNIRLLNITTEPVSVREVYKFLSGDDFVNELPQGPYNYNIKSIYAEMFGGREGYMINKNTELCDLKEFVDEEIRKKWL